MELQLFSTAPSHISTSISKHPKFVNIQGSPYSTTSSLGTVSKSRACFNLHQRPHRLQFTSNGRQRCSSAQASPVSKGTAGNPKQRPSTKREETENSDAENSDTDSDDEDPNWPEEEGWGFPLSEFFNELKITNIRDEDDLDYLTEDEIEWEDDSAVPAVKEIRAKDWEDAAFGDISPLVVFVYERYHRPIDNMKVRDELAKAINVFWDSDKPSPRAVKFDAAQEPDLKSALNVKDTPVIIFLKDGKLLHRQTEILMADQLVKIMAYFYYGANQPDYLKTTKLAGEKIPNLA